MPESGDGSFRKAGRCPGPRPSNATGDDAVQCCGRAEWSSDAPPTTPYRRVDGEYAMTGAVLRARRRSPDEPPGTRQQPPPPGFRTVIRQLVVRVPEACLS